MMFQGPAINGQSLLSLLFSVSIPKDICTFDCTIRSIEVNTNKMATNSLSMLWRCPFIGVYFSWKSSQYMSKAYGHGRWLLVAGLSKAGTAVL